MRHLFEPLEGRTLFSAAGCPVAPAPVSVAAATTTTTTTTTVVPLARAATPTVKGAYSGTFFNTTQQGGGTLDLTLTTQTGGKIAGSLTFTATPTASTTSNPVTTAVTGTVNKKGLVVFKGTGLVGTAKVTFIGKTLVATNGAPFSGAYTLKLAKQSSKGTFSLTKVS